MKYARRYHPLDLAEDQINSLGAGLRVLWIFIILYIVTFISAVAIWYIQQFIIGIVENIVQVLKITYAIILA